jgi:hypothetical protein
MTRGTNQEEPEVRAILSAGPRKAAKILNEFESKSSLQAYGVPVSYEKPCFLC